MLTLRIKQAECALADGRLDEAFGIAKTDDVREHRRGQKLIGKLSRALAKRGWDNLAADRLHQALTDCNKADKLGGNLPKIAELRTAICKAMEEKQHKHQKQSLRLAKARERIENGWLSAGERILVDCTGGSKQAEILLETVAEKRLEIDALVAKAEQALKREDLEGAIDILRKSETTLGQDSRLSDMKARTRSLAKKCIIEYLSSGRIDQADHLLRRIGPSGAESIEIRELALAVSQCRQAAEHVAAGRPHQAAKVLRKVKNCLPSVQWLDKAIEHVEQAGGALDALCEGPLGLSFHDASDVEEPHVGPHAEDTSSSGAECTSDESGLSPAVPQKQRDVLVPPAFVLQVDGVGSFLVACNESVTVGPISSSARPTVGLVADPSLGVVSIERADDDYFIRSPEPILVNDQQVTEKLLYEGDRIVLTSMCHMKFHLPNAASTTATLALSSGRLLRPDIRQVILMDRDILIGPDFSNHILADSSRGSVTLFKRNGHLHCKAQQRVMVNEQPFDPSRALPMSVPIRIGEISLVLTELTE